MKIRILAAVVLAPALLAILVFAPKIVTALLFGAICFVGAYELLVRTGLVKHGRLALYGMIFAFLVPMWCYFDCPMLWGQVGIWAFFVLMFMEMMLSQMKLPFQTVCCCFVGALLIPYMLSAVLRIFLTDAGRFLVIVPFAVAFLADSGAYFVGCKFGKHKLAPVISPKKSVEGFLGGLVAAVLGMLLYGLILQLCFGKAVQYGNLAIISFLGALAGTFGDLCFSVVKRQTGIKDYGNIIPGHGGVLDRFDSVIVVAPLVEILMTFLPVLVM